MIPDSQTVEGTKTSESLRTVTVPVQNCQRGGASLILPLPGVKFDEEVDCLGSKEEKKKIIKTAENICVTDKNYCTSHE